LTSLFHALVGWGFGFYLLVNLLDVARGYLPGFEISGMAGNVYRLLADVLSVGVLAGMIFFLVRRFVFRPDNLSTRESTLLHPKARAGIRRDSAFVGGFILLHVGSRFLGESFVVAAQDHANGWQPAACPACLYMRRLQVHLPRELRGVNGFCQGVRLSPEGGLRGPSRSIPREASPPKVPGGGRGRSAA